MDGLALLCTLYGDGPMTLRRLREAGWNDAERLEEIEVERLAEAIGLPVEQARRLQREARGLLDRVEGPATTPPSGPLVPPLAADERVPAEAVDRADVESDAARDVLIPQRPPASPASPALSAEAVDGLDVAAVRALREAGLATLEDLVGADEVELTRSTGLPLTRLLRWRFLAKRALQDAPAARVPAPPVELEAPERFSPAEVRGPLDEPPSGGPFA